MQRMALALSIVWLVVLVVTIAAPVAGAEIGPVDEPGSWAGAEHADGFDDVGPRATERPNETVSATLGAEPQFDGLSANSAAFSEWDVHDVDSANGGECWRSDIANDGRYIYFDVGDDVSVDGTKNARVTVEYLDRGAGHFGIKYDGHSGKYVRDDTVATMADSGEWKTETFLLEDARFANRQNRGHDFRIDPSVGGDYGLSGSDYCIRRVSVTPTTATTLDVKVRQRQAGNVFYANQTPALSVATVGDRVSLRVRNYTGATVVETERSIDTDDWTAIDVPVDREGYFEVTITAVDGEEQIGRERRAVAVIEHRDVGDVDDFFGMSGHVPPYSANVTSLLTAAGVTEYRSGYGWNETEVADGVYEPQEWVVDDFRELPPRGIDVLAGIWFSNVRFVQPPEGSSLPADEAKIAPYTTDQRRAYVDYARAVVTDVPYAERIHSVEVWNEYNHDATFAKGPAGGDAKNYTRLLSMTYPAIKDARSDVTVTGIGNGWHDYEFFTKSVEHGALESLDTVSIHPYRRRWSPEDRQGEHGIGNFYDEMTEVKRVVRTNTSSPKPVWVTEFGYTTEKDLVDERTQARWIVRSHAMAKAAGVERFYWYEFFPRPGSDAKYNLLRPGDHALGGYTPRPSYVSYAVMTRELTGTAPVGQDEVTATNAEEPIRDVYSYVFEKDGQPRRTIWSLAPTTVTLETSDPLTVVDTMGNERTVEPTDGTVALTVGPGPVYVHGPVSDVSATVVTDFLASGQITGGTISDAGARDGTIDISLQNTARNTALALTGVEWTVGNESGSASLSRTIEAGSSVTVSVPVPAAEAWAPRPATITLQFADRRSLELPSKTVSFNPAYRGSHTVDATLEEVASTPAIRLPQDGTVANSQYTGPDDLSGAAWITWDEDYLYLSARLTDDTHASGWPLWKYDSLQFGVADGVPTAGRHFTELNVALTPDGPQVYRLVQPSGPGSSRLRSAEVAAARRDGETVYEVAIPWDAVNASPDGPVSVSLLANDNDGDGREGYLAWAGGIGSGKDRGEFRTLTLLDESPDGAGMARSESPSTSKTEAATRSTPTAGPGLGVVAALLALLCTFLGRRYDRGR